MGKLTTKPTSIEGVFLVESQVFKDERGQFQRLFCEDELHTVIGDRRIRQINYSKTSNKGTVRGLHFQVPPFQEMKIIRCIKGSILDIGVDLRQNSPTFLKHIRIELTETNNFALVLPEGVAHGFQSLENDIEMIYLHTHRYQANSEAGIPWDDPILAIDWPLPVTEISQRDKNHSYLTKDYKGL